MADAKHSKQNKPRKKSSASGKRRKKRSPKSEVNRRHMAIALLLVGLAVFISMILLVLSGQYEKIVGSSPFAEKTEDGTGEWEREDLDGIDDGRPPLDVQLLTPNKYSRPEIALKEINGIVIHYTANPGATAQGNHDYFEKLKDTGEAFASSHFVIGLEGEIIQCIPSSEISYASNDRNVDTLSIECCHPDDSGKFNDATYQSLVELTAWLCRHFEISPDNIIRHYDVTGKICPKYFVEHEDEWEKFLSEVREAI